MKHCRTLYFNFLHSIQKDILEEKQQNEPVQQNDGIRLCGRRLRSLIGLRSGR